MAKNIFAEARKLVKPEDGTIAYVITIDGVTKLHNWDGPALINKEQKIKEYYLHGFECTIDDWKEMRNFKKTELKRNEEGIELEIDRIRNHLNQMYE